MSPEVRRRIKSTGCFNFEMTSSPEHREAEHREHMRAHFGAMDVSQLHDALSVRELPCNGTMDHVIATLTNHEVLYSNFVHVLCMEAKKSCVIRDVDRRGGENSFRELLLRSSDGKRKSATFIDGASFIFVRFRRSPT